MDSVTTIELTCLVVHLVQCGIEIGGDTKLMTEDELSKVRVDVHRERLHDLCTQAKSMYQSISSQTPSFLILGRTQNPPLGLAKQIIDVSSQLETAIEVDITESRSKSKLPKSFIDVKRIEELRGKLEIFKVAFQKLILGDLQKHISKLDAYHYAELGPNTRHFVDQLNAGCSQFEDLVQKPTEQDEASSTVASSYEASVDSSDTLITVATSVSGAKGFATRRRATISNRPNSLGRQVATAQQVSKAKGFTARQIATATNKLIFELREDKDLRKIYPAALLNDAIGPVGLTNALLRLLRSCSEDLNNEAHDQLQRLTARIIGLKARIIVRSVIKPVIKELVLQDALDPATAKDGLQMTKGPYELEGDEDFADEDDELVVDEVGFPDLVVVREFFLNSRALQKFRTELQDSVAPPNWNNQKIHHELREIQPKMRYDLRREWATVTIPKLPLEETDSEDPRHYAQHPNILNRLLFTISKYFYRFIFYFELVEPVRAAQSHRLRWICRCGAKGWSDVIDLKPGGSFELMDELEKSTGVHFVSDQAPQSNNSIAKVRRWLALTWIPLLNRDRQRHCILPLPEASPQLHNNALEAQNRVVSQESLHVMTIMNNGIYKRDLFQDRIEEIDNDRKLFTFFQEQFRSRKGRFKSRLSLRNVGIEFAKFRLFVGGSVELRHHQACCTSSLCECLPPEDKVYPEESAEYRCKPIPPLTSPPALPDYLRHLLAQPSCIDERSTYFLNQLPKRLQGELRGDPHEPAEGWGIYYSEEWDVAKIKWLVSIVFGLGSLVFGVLWYKFEMDLQGAFAVSAYMMSLVVILSWWG